jgi:hypothetical protein
MNEDITVRANGLALASLKRETTWNGLYPKY